MTLTALLGASLAAAQSTPATPAAQPAPAQAAPATPAPVQPAAPKVAPTPAPKGAVTLDVTSALAVEVSGTVKGRLISCPKNLKVTGSAVCLYTQNTLPSLRSVLRGKMNGRIVSDWKTTASEKSSSMIVRTGMDRAYILLAQLSPTEALVVVDGLPRTTTAVPATPAMPAGIVKGQAYVLDTDLRGLVNVASIGNGAYRLASVAGGPVLTVNSGKKTATLGGGSVDLPLAPVSDGRNLLFPVDGLRSLACTVTPAQVGVTVSCGSASANVRPIVF
ncbi:hypothetical protein GCM10008939_00350 [Deinococcus aquiradiocola]|uniref:Uncharacterized protein n=1 Tax=Deinococcus aquiradiocola TaxID=393059 RepID=A0A917UIB1_9DEIO|nr:hypothetical protein GCM10008939_00350 [Deinococcus aquiradiocola]